MASSVLRRVPTGILGLDSLIEGGFPERSLILVTGAPGSGKTSMCYRFLERGASLHNQVGLYVSFFESKDMLERYVVHQLGQASADLVKSGMIRILAFPTLKGEGISSLVDSIIDTIKEARAKRLVIDSITALLGSMEEIEARTFAHTILTRIVPSYGCTTLVTKETSSEDPYVGGSAEDFVADGVISLRNDVLRGRTIRELRIWKLRGTRIESPVITFTLEDGFSVFPPFSYRALRQIGRLERLPDSEQYFSTGIASLDKILGGGYPRGSLALLETDEGVPLPAYGMLSYPIVAKFLNNKSPLIGVQSMGVDPTRTYERWKAVAGENAMYGRSVERLRGKTTDRLPYMAYLRGQTPEKRMEQYLKIGENLRNQRKMPVIWWIGLDHFVDIFGTEHVEEALSAVSTTVIHHRELAVVLAKPGLKRLTTSVSNMAATHIRMLKKNASLLIYGVSPPTSLYIVDVDPERGLSSINLVPIV